MEELAFMERVVLIAERSIPVAMVVEAAFYIWFFGVLKRRK